MLRLSPRAGGLVAFVLTPMELIKSRLQVQTTAPSGAVAGKRAYAGPIDCITKSIRYEGFSVLYRGHMATVLREVPGTAAWFGVYELVVRVRGDVGELGVSQVFGVFAASHPWHCDLLLVYALHCAGHCEAVACLRFLWWHHCSECVARHASFVFSAVLPRRARAGAHACRPPLCRHWSHTPPLVASMTTKR